MRPSWPPPSTPTRAERGSAPGLARRSTAEPHMSTKGFAAAGEAAQGAGASAAAQAERGSRRKQSAWRGSGACGAHQTAVGSSEAAAAAAAAVRVLPEAEARAPRAAPARRALPASMAAARPARGAAARARSGAAAAAAGAGAAARAARRGAAPRSSAAAPPAAAGARRSCIAQPLPPHTRSSRRARARAMPVHARADRSLLAAARDDARRDAATHEMRLCAAHRCIRASKLFIRAAFCVRVAFARQPCQRAAVRRRAPPCAAHLGFTAPAAPKGPCRRGGPQACRRRAERVSRWALCAPFAHLGASAQRVTTRCSWNLPRVCLPGRICTSRQRSRAQEPAPVHGARVAHCVSAGCAAQAQRSARGREQARARSRARMRRTARRARARACPQNTQPEKTQKRRRCADARFRCAARSPPTSSGRTSCTSPRGTWLQSGEEERGDEMGILSACAHL